MRTPLEIALKHVDHTPDLERRLRERAEHLERFYERLVRCRIVVEGPNAHARSKLYRVHIELGVPGPDIVVDQGSAGHHEHVDLNLAIRDAFDAAERRLKEYARKQRGESKTHGS
jgi:ribosome-associated translation inhibitor RaiA